MPSITGVLQESILSSVCESEESVRRASLEAISNPVKKIASLVLHELAIHYPNEVARIIRLEQSTNSTQFIAAGFDAVVYKTKQGVVKVHKESIGRSHQDQAELASNKLKEHEQLSAALGSFVLGQSTNIEPHPVYKKLPVVATRQRFVPSIRDTDLFEEDNCVRKNALHEMGSEDSAILPQLKKFAEHSRALFDSTGLIPDLWGKCNLVTSYGNLYMIDGQPLNQERDVDVHPLSLQRLNNLENSL